jgi:hypothetical protein
VKNFAILLLVFLSLVRPMFGEIIPADRVINWQGSAGVRGDIPTRPIYADVTRPPFSVVGNGVRDAYPGIQGAINACPAGKTVYIPAGTYYISAALKIKSGISVRGAGMGVTTIIGSSNVNMVTMNTPGMDDSYRASTARNLAPTGLTKGSTSITTTTAHGWVAGDYVMIDQLKNPLGNPPIDNAGVSGTAIWLGREAGKRCIGQWVKIVTVPTPNTATIDPPLYFPYDITSIPQGYKVSGATVSAGLEDITFDNHFTGLRDIMEMDFCVNCWCLRVELKGSNRRALWMYGGLWNTIRGCKIHDGVPVDPQPGSSYSSDRAYGIFLGPGPSACLIEDNIFHTLSNCIAYEGAASGNVVAYNYMTNVLWSDNNSARMTIIGHGAHPMMNLVEGNWLEGRFGADCYWGTSSHFTIFRNRIQQQGPPSVSQAWTIDINRRNWYHNIVGNILGTPAWENTYELSGATYSYDYGPRAIYRLGYQAVESTFNIGDSFVLNTIYRHGNWDSVNNAQIWEASNTDHALPDSLYLSRKPAWFGSLTWPPFDPARPGSATASSIPAGKRFATSRLLNVSTRSYVQTDSNVLIGGFIIKGRGAQKVIVRGIGPSLGSGGLADPILELHKPHGPVVTNDNWKTGQRAQIEATGLAPGNDREAAIVATLPAGNYTAVLRGKNNTTGIGLIEMYDLGTAGRAELANISSRGFIGTGNNILIGGVILGPAGSPTSRVLVRAIGPSLASAGIARPLLDPVLELHNKDGVLMVANDDWKDRQQVALQTTGVPPGDDRESAIVFTAAPGNYTAIVRGRSGTTGVAIVELYNLH